MIQKHRFSLLPYLKKRNETSALHGIYLRITVDGKRSEVSVKMDAHPSDWNASKGRVKGTSEQHRIINHSIESMEHRAREIYNQWLSTGRIITATDIKNELTGIESKNKLVLVTFHEFIASIENRIGTSYAAGTVKNWKVTAGHLQNFIKKFYRKDDLSFKEIPASFLIDFDQYARVHWKCGTNAVLKHIQRFRKIIHLAVDKNWLEKDPFTSFRGKWDPTHRTFLTIQELQEIENKFFKTERLKRVCDLFIFSCYTGLSFIDLEHLSVKNLFTGIDGNPWIQIRRHKTNQSCTIPLLPKALSLIEKYKDDPECCNKGILLPVISNMKTNEYLKEIASICGIEKNLTFHMARHTFATTITLSNGVPLETVSSLLGHAKITTTQIYAKVVQHKISQDIQLLRTRCSLLQNE